MFKITDQHLHAFCESLTHQYAMRLASRLKERFQKELTGLEIGEEEVLPFVKQAIDRARLFGVDRTLDVELFVDCCVLLGPDFDKSPYYSWSGEILNRNDLGGTEKMDLIHDYLIFATDKVR